MVQTITPVVHGGSRRRWAVSLLLHVLGATASAGAAGALLGGTGALLGAPWGGGGMLLVAAIGLVYAAREIFEVRVPLPEVRRQVPEWWRGALGARTSSLLYGLALGPGVGTHLRHGTFVAVVAVVVAVGDPVLGMITLGAFGLARALGVAVVSNARTSTAVGDVGDRLERLGAGRLPRIANGAALVAIAVTALSSDLRGEVPPSWIWPAALAVTFAWAALVKILRPAAWREALGAYALPRWMERLAERSVTFSEAAVVALLLAGQTRAGSAIAALLLGTFTIGLLRARRGGVQLVPCGCFGGKRTRSLRWLLTRNMLLFLVAAAAFAVGGSIPLPSAPGSEELLPAALVGVGGGLTLWLLLRAVSLAQRERVTR